MGNSPPAVVKLLNWLAGIPEWLLAARKRQTLVGWDSRDFNIFSFYLLIYLWRRDDGNRRFSTRGRKVQRSIIWTNITNLNAFSIELGFQKYFSLVPREKFLPGGEELDYSEVNDSVAAGSDKAPELTIWNPRKNPSDDKTSKIGWLKFERISTRG
ncbi:hypothetical protein NPIL_283141 [Nephila pilipes]|uniref:Uncharacterized protein n=1 Tax=Nephila pilipes TaxID=299642 RepID=A0A8X6TZJ7_NEPPI|nr:hypothetical protein NPIL_283141 [Nephila pilipes]